MVIRTYFFLSLLGRLMMTVLVVVVVVVIIVFASGDIPCFAGSQSAGVQKGCRSLWVLVWDALGPQDFLSQKCSVESRI